MSSVTLTVNLGERSYPISFCSDLADEVRAKVAGLISAGRSVAVLTDQNLIDNQFGALHEMFPDLPMHIVAPGEATKSLTEFGRVLDFLATQRMERTGVLFTVGGGVIGDLGGLPRRLHCAASTIFRCPRPARDGGQLGGRQDGCQPPGGQEFGRGVPPAARRFHFHQPARDAAAARIFPPGWPK